MENRCLKVATQLGQRYEFEEVQSFNYPVIGGISAGSICMLALKQLLTSKVISRTAKVRICKYKSIIGMVMYACEAWTSREARIISKSGFVTKRKDGPMKR